MADVGATTLTELDAFLWSAASNLRGYVNSDDFQNYILPLLFYKWVSDTWDLEHSVAVSDHGTETTPERGKSYHRFAVPDGCHWADLKTSSQPGLTLQAILDRLAAANPERFAGVLDSTRWGERQRLPDRVIFDLIYFLDQITLNRSTLPDETLGDAYEYMISKFADASGKTASELSPSPGVIRLLVQILDARPGETVYDPACGTGSTLIGAATEIRETGRDARTLKLYGQEVSQTKAAIARMNLIIHGLENFSIADGDTLRAPSFREGSELQKFNVVIGIPPFSVKNWGSDTWARDPYGRAFCGVPPASRADLAWVQHIVSSMNADNGRAAVILPHGALFRAGPERYIRRCLVERDCVDAVIGLPPKLLSPTNIPVCLVIMRANKRHERRGAIVFIDASACCIKDRSRNKLNPEHLEPILAAYRRGESETLPTRFVHNTEIAERDWDLEVGRYVKATEQAEISDHRHNEIPPSRESHGAEQVPSSLATQALADVCDVLPGRNRIAKQGEEDSEFRVVRAEDIRLSLTPWSDLPQSNPRKASSVEIAPGDIIGSISGPYGRWIVVPEDYGPAFASDHTVVLRGHNGVSMWFVLGFLRSPQGMELIKNTQHGAVISRITPDELKRIPVPRCPLPSDYVDPVLKGFAEEHGRLEHSIGNLYHRLQLIYDSAAPVEVAARLDSLQGITASMRKMTGLGETVRIARSSYPYPIARNLHAMGNTLSLRERYHEAVHEILETLSVVLTSICAAVARENATRDGRASKQWMRATGRGGATIGVRSGMIFEVAGQLIRLNSSEDLGGLGRALGDPGAPAARLIRRLLLERNRIHGDYPRTEFQFQQRLLESEGDIHRLLEALSFLARWELRFSELVEPLEGEHYSTYFSAKFRVLRGDNPDWELTTFKSQNPLYRGRVYALVDDQVLIDLHPFLLVLPCQVCGALEVYHPVSFSEDEVRLGSIDRGHSQTNSDPGLLRAVQAAFA